MSSDALHGGFRGRREASGDELNRAIEFVMDADWAKAGATARKILSDDADVAGAWTVLGLAENGMGRFERALDAFARSLSIAPSDPWTYNSLGVVLMRHGRDKQAVAAFTRALAADPEHRDSRLNIGVLLARMDFPDAAEEHLRQAAEFEPPSAEANYQLGLLLCKSGRRDEGRQFYRRAVEADPAHVAAGTALAVQLQQQGLANEAERQLKAILEIAPDNAAVLAALGAVYEDLGDAESAIGAYLRALEVDPGHETSLSRIIVLNPGDPAHFEQMAQELLEHERVPDQQKVRLAFALGKSFERQERYAEAFAHMRIANELQKKELPAFDPVKHQQLVSSIMASFDQAFFADREAYGDRNARPIFIVGMPRSGTTLAEQIIASHPDVDGAGEQQFFLKLSAELSQGTGTDNYPAAATRFSADDVARRAADYLLSLAPFRHQGTRTTDKMPVNFLHIGLIALLFPGASVINCRRDPLDVVLSCYKEGFHRETRFTTDLVWLAAFYNEYERLMDHWRHVLPMPILDVQYEDHVQNFDTGVARILDHCGLSWDERCLRFFETERTVGTPSRWQVRQPVYATSVGKWRNYRAELEPVIDKLAPFRSGFA